MTIHLSEERERFVRALIQGGRYASEDEVIDEALRLLEQRDSEHAEDRERMDALLIQGLDSGPSTPMTSKDWDQLEQEGQRITAARNRLVADSLPLTQ